MVHAIGIRFRNKTIKGQQNSQKIIVLKGSAFLKTINLQ